MVDATRTVLIWIVGIILTLNVEDTNYHWENLKTGAIVIEIIGFLILVCGNLTYNELIVFPFAKPPCN